MELKDLAFVQDIAGQAYTSIRKVRWSSEQIRAKYANRSGPKMITDGDTFYMGCCPDLTLSAAHRFDHVDEPYVLVVEMFHKSPEFPLVRPHVVLELPKRNGYIDFTRLNQITVGSGEYPGNGDKSTLITKVNSGKMTTAQPLHGALHFSRRDQINGLFAGLNIDSLIDKMIADNTDQNWNNYRTRVPENLPAFVTKI